MKIYIKCATTELFSKYLVIIPYTSLYAHVIIYLFPNEYLYRPNIQEKDPNRLRLTAIFDPTKIKLFTVVQDEAYLN